MKNSLLYEIILRTCTPAATRCLVFFPAVATKPSHARGLSYCFYVDFDAITATVYLWNESSYKTYRDLCVARNYDTRYIWMGFWWERSQAVHAMAFIHDMIRARCTQRLAPVYPSEPNDRSCTEWYPCYCVDVMGVAESWWLSAFHKRTCLSFPCFDTYRQTVSAHKSTREMHHASSQKTKTAASPISSSNISKMYRVLRLNALLIFDTDEPTASPYMYTHNTYRTALYTTSHCTEHVKYRMPLFLLHKR